MLGIPGFRQTLVDVEGESHFGTEPSLFPLGRDSYYFARVIHLEANPRCIVLSTELTVLNRLSIPLAGSM